MPNIKPVSDLRNYTSVLTEVRRGSPVYLTKNGRGCYAIVEISELDVNSGRRVPSVRENKATLPLR